MDKFNFIFSGNIHFGVKSRSILDSILKDNGYRSACIIIDHALLLVPIFNEYLDKLKCDINIIECDISEPTYEKLEDQGINIIEKMFFQTFDLSKLLKTKLIENQSIIDRLTEDQNKILTNHNEWKKLLVNWVQLDDDL